MNESLKAMIETARAALATRNIARVNDDRFQVVAQRTQGRLTRGGAIRVDVYCATTGKRIPKSEYL